uniref:Uncharacterized protein n=1 Tax=Klebsiella pneumoniae TaxID=573 RepID=A0A8B0SV29_KLEPN|nr:hypothetical protein [Klebsiella pneumoniae]
MFLQAHVIKSFCPRSGLFRFRPELDASALTLTQTEQYCLVLRMVAK